jgi:hypothetical protein
MRSRPLQITVVVLALVVGTFWYLGWHETQAELRFARAFHEYQKNLSAMYDDFRNSDGALNELAAKYDALASVGGLSSVTTAAMSLPPEIRKVALRWTESEQKALRLKARMWRLDILSPARERAEQQSQAAEDEADHILDQLEGMLGDAPRKALFKGTE